MRSATTRRLKVATCRRRPRPPPAASLQPAVRRHARHARGPRQRPRPSAPFRTRAGRRGRPVVRRGTPSGLRRATRPSRCRDLRRPRPAVGRAAAGTRRARPDLGMRRHDRRASLTSGVRISGPTGRPSYVQRLAVGEVALLHRLTSELAQRARVVQRDAVLERAQRDEPIRRAGVDVGEAEPRRDASSRRSTSRLPPARRSR